MSKLIRVLIAEDVRTTYLLLRKIIEDSGEFEVVGWAADGEEVVQKTRELIPDIITMDIQMPRKNGLQAIDEIMSSSPVPIVVISSHSNNESMNLTFEALHVGALDVIGKPMAINDANFPSYCNELRTKLAAMSVIKLVRRRRRNNISAINPLSSPIRCSGKELIALGASAGGPEALHKIFSIMPADFPLPIVITQHIVSGFISGMVNWLNQQCDMHIKLAESHEVLLPGTVYFANDEAHMLITRQNGRLIVKLEDTAPVGGFKPSINMMLESVAVCCGKRAIGGIMTGMGSDGAMGLKTMFEKGANTFAQDEASCLIFGMPAVAQQMGAVQKILPLTEIAQFLQSFKR